MLLRQIVNFFSVQVYQVRENIELPTNVILKIPIKRLGDSFLPFVSISFRCTRPSDHFPRQSYLFRSTDEPRSGTA